MPRSIQEPREFRCSRRKVLAGGLAGLTGSFAGLVGSTAGTARGAARPIRSDAATVVTRLRQWLLSQQSTDGHWRSDHYGVLRSGQAMTPWVLWALLQCDSDATETDSYLRAVRWIRVHLRDGCLGVADSDVLEYPVYATSLALLAGITLRQRGIVADDQSQRDIEAMVTWLKRQQFDASRGISPDHPGFGGWGFGGNQPAGKTGHLDLAHTRYALQSLAMAGELDQKQRSNALRLLRMLQKLPSEDRPQPVPSDGLNSGTTAEERDESPFDGGFYFSPVILAANKGRGAGNGQQRWFRSYATATCEGVLAILAAGVARDDFRVRAAREWLLLHDDWEYPAGIPRDYPEPWGKAVYFYHQMIRAQTYRGLAIDTPWRQPLIERIAGQMDAEGKVVNHHSPLMKEDDPLLTTAMALVAVCSALP